MIGFLATLAMGLVASGGFQVFLPSITNGLEWIGVSDLRLASCRYETWQRRRVSSEPEAWSPWQISSVKEYDREGRGVYGISYHTSYTSTGWTDYYNGLSVRSRYDKESDGVVDEIGYNVYDAHNNHVLRSVYSDVGSKISSYRYYYDHFNRLVREDLDYDGDGVLDVLTTREYGAAGQPLRDTEESLSTGRRTIYEHTYVDGLIISSQYSRIQADGFISSEGEDRYTLDARKRLIRLHSLGRYNPTGELVESEITYEYDNLGNVVHFADNDITRGHFAGIRFEYDERGFLTDRYGRNYLGGLSHTRHSYEGCEAPLNSVVAEIKTFAGVVPIEP